MNTTAIFAELLVAGLLALVWLALVVLSFTRVTGSDAAAFASQMKDWASLISVFVLGFAYALGIIVDRVADSLFHRVDRGIRRRHLDKKLPSAAEMRLCVMADADKLAGFLDYIRSRQRITRSASLNLLLISLASAVFLTRRSSAGILWVSSTAIAALALAALSLFAWERISETYYKRLAQSYTLLKEQDRHQSEGTQAHR